MSSDNNIINLNSRLEQTQEKSESIDKSKAKASTDLSEPSSVHDMTQRREATIRNDRRNVKRTILTEFIGAFVVLPGVGLVKVALYDISDNGVAFDLPVKMGGFKSGEEIPMRVYLNHKTYFPFYVTAANVRTIEDEQVIRHGGAFVKGTVNEDALFHFVKFIETVSTSLRGDSGDVMVSNLNQT